MTDQDHATAVYKASKQFEVAMQRAADAGLHVDIETFMHCQVHTGGRAPIVAVTVKRIVSPETGA